MRLFFVVILPIFLQLGAFLFVADWAGGQGDGKGFLGIAALMLLLIAVPITLVANVWMMKETRKWRLLWCSLTGCGQAIVIPGAIVVALLLSIN